MDWGRLKKNVPVPDLSRNECGAGGKMITLPCDFTEKMKDLLGDEYDAFLASYEHPRNFGLRVNVNKITPEEFEALAPFHLTKIPWTENGYYYEEQDAPARHPFYHAGLYYLQEPSAMTPASRLHAEPGDKVLDLCAAPGGKATELGARLHGRGVLVANDISASRARALLKNIEVFGIANSFVVNEVPAKLAEQFAEFFDKILVDAPCSGEGMFRKDPAVAKVWDAEKPFACAKQQKEIISRAAQMLAPGGQLLYSTCTFSPEENEQVIQFLLDSRDDMELLEIPGYEGFAPGRPDVAYDNWMERNAEVSGNPELKKCVRIWPQRMAGEGHFLALMRKKGQKTRNEASMIKVSDQHTAKLSEIKLSKPDRAALEEFFKDVTMEIDWNYVEVRKGQVYYVPKDLGQRKGIVFLRNGLYLGEIKKDRFEPSQSFAMALRKEEYASAADLHYSDERVMKYLKGETIEIDDIPVGRSKGWQLVCVNGYPLGWGKLVNGTLKNKYHAGWRAR